MPTNTVEKIYMKVQYDYKYSSYSIYIVCSVVSCVFPNVNIQTYKRDYSQNK